MASRTTQNKIIKVAFAVLVFWLGIFTQALARECAPSKQITPIQIGSRCKEDPSCVVIGGTHMLEWKSHAPAKIIVVCIHGLGLCARAYKTLAQELSAAGIDGYGVNVRGFGPDRDRPERAKLNCLETVEDVNSLLRGIHHEHPDYKVFLIGESMGGALTIRIAAENPDIVDGIVCSAPAWKLLKIKRTAIKGIFELFILPGKKPGIASRGVVHQATSDQNLADHWLHDSSHKLKLSFGEATAFMKFIKKTDTYAKQLTKPVMVVQGLKDNLVSPKTTARLYKNISSGNKVFLIDAKGEHLLLEEGRYSKALTKKLVDWLKTDHSLSEHFKLVEVINDELLSQGELRQLRKLQLLASPESD